jgi:hypothetical protein
LPDAAGIRTQDHGSLSGQEEIFVRELDESKALEQVCERLGARFPTVPLATVQATVQELHAKLVGPVRNYVPILVERAATDGLSAITASCARP